jgi:flagellar biosynthesis/type III secretory pathway protein FliH
MLAAKTPEMKKAVGRLKRLSADEATRMRYEARELYLMDEMARRDKAHADGLAEGEAKGLAEGKAEGLAEGEAKGLAEGEAKGEQKKAVEMAKNLLSRGVSPDIIAESSGLSLDKINSLIS